MLTPTEKKNETKYYDILSHFKFLVMNFKKI